MHNLSDLLKAYIFSVYYTSIQHVLGLFIFCGCDVFYFLIVVFSTPHTWRKTLKVSLKVSSTQSAIIVGSPLERNAEESAYAGACVRTDARLCVLNVCEGRIS